MLLRSAIEFVSSPSKQLLHYENSFTTSPYKMTYLLLPVMVMMAASNVLSQCNLPGPNPQRCRDWHIGADRVRPSGVVVHGHANTPSHNGVQGTVHGSHVFGGPHNGAQTVGGGLNYQKPNGLHGGVDATHARGQGTSYSGNVGGSTRVGPGTLSVSGGAGTIPGSSKVQGQVGATYSVPLP